MIHVLITLTLLFLFGYGAFAVGHYLLPPNSPRPPSGLEMGIYTRAAQQEIISGALLIRSYREDQRETERLDEGLKTAKKYGPADKVKEYQQAISDVQNRQSATISILISQISQSAGEYTPAVLSEQLETLEQDLGKLPGTKQIMSFAQEFVQQVKMFKAGHALNKELLGKRMLEI